ncbi:protein of unknown function [Chitinophaga eiseniae]|uniref:Conjugal transfer protein TraQ n=1 Tax=Chitinophaga eiseniae TaxID=634771 RepID=A0A1T4SY10_9BACT|nr:DUF3872 domain-containing protein [Chitinophaga eiseniae]SKA33134.1 protein of unknown function [Chitinophaga eiseniae]
MKTLIQQSNLQQQTLWAFVFIAILSVLFTSCRKKDLDIQQNFPFEVKVMPVPKELALGQVAEIRLTLVPSGNFDEARYYIRYFQEDGEGSLQYYSDPPYLPNDLYSLPEHQFRLYYSSRSKVSQTINVWISDNFGNEKELSFRFNSKD